MTAAALINTATQQPHATGLARFLDIQETSMQFVCSSKRTKRKAKLLKRALDKRGRGIPYTKCLNLMAQLFGFEHFFALTRVEGFFEASATDDFVDKETLEARFSHQEQVMAAAGFEDIAGELLDEVDPTGGRSTPAPSDAELPAVSNHDA